MVEDLPEGQEMLLACDDLFGFWIDSPGLPQAMDQLRRHLSHTVEAVLWRRVWAEEDGRRICGFRGGLGAAHHRQTLFRHKNDNNVGDTTGLETCLGSLEAL